MLVLHALWDDAGGGRLHLWIERPPRVKARSGYHPGARGHPALARATNAWLGETFGARARPSRLTLHLPTQNGLPMPSPELGLDLAGTSEIGQQPWVVPTLAPRNPSVALRKLARLARAALPGHLTLGASTRFWLAAGALVDDLIARDGFAPYAGDDEMTLLARWSPVYAATPSARLRALAAAMPGVCRAIIPPQIAPGHHRPPDATPLLAHFLEHVLDRRARQVMRLPLLEAAPRQDRSAVARWLRRLSGPSRHAYLPVRSLDDHQFGETLRAWLAPFHVLPQARGRLCVQLDEPSEDEQRGWRLSYYLQDVDEPSVLIPARQIWYHDSRDAVIAQRRFITAAKTLLADLAYAATLCPPIAESMRLAMPEGAAITLEQAHTFLREGAAALEAADIGVRVPAWWKQQRTLTVELNMDDHEAFFGVETLVKFNWQAALGDMVLTRAEFETLSRLKAPLAQVRGQWVEVNADNLRRALRYFDRHSDGLTLPEVLRGRQWCEQGHRPGRRPGGRARALARAPRTLTRRAAHHARVAPEGVCGRIAAISTARPGVAGVLERVRAGRVPGRRHGPRQDRAVAGARRALARQRRTPRPRAAGVPDVDRRQLATGGRTVHARSEAVRASRRRPAGGHGAEPGRAPA
jgi:hypothetical protein